ncbi:hypothetical protein [Amycolatopsis pigmentata]|uniref:Uncharacterized protein n=1 Tax=Amycolatopsis pigmentata TaxID=450801 RepID=A0ABW5G2Z9_9PSEU
MKPYITIDEPGTLLSYRTLPFGSACWGSAMAGSAEAALLRRRVDGNVVLGHRARLIVDLSSVKQPPIEVPHPPRERNP